MKNTYTLFLLISLTSFILVSCAGGSTKKESDTAVHDESVTDDDTPRVSQAEDVEVVKPEDKKVTVSAEEPLSQAIKKQSDAEITKTATELLMANPTNIKALNALGLSNYKKGKYKAAEFF